MSDVINDNFPIGRIMQLFNIINQCVMRVFLYIYNITHPLVMIGNYWLGTELGAFPRFRYLVPNWLKTLPNWVLSTQCRKGHGVKYQAFCYQVQLPVPLEDNVPVPVPVSVPVPVQVPVPERHMQLP